MRIKSLFVKQVMLYFGILLISFSVLGGSLTRVYRAYYISQKEDQLMEQAHKLAEAYTRPFFTGVVDLSNLKRDMQVLTKYTGAQIFLLDSERRVFAVSSNIRDEWVGQTINDEVIDNIYEGNAVSAQGSVGGMFSETVLTVGYPITISNKVLGGIFLSLSMPAIEAGLRDVQKASFLAIVLIFVLSTSLIYWSSKRTTRPLLEMNKAAKVIASGNFEKRIEIESADEVGQLAESFNEMAESLDSHEQLRREFIANISHDLRSPLTSIQGFLGAILDGTVPEEKQNHYLQIVLDETKRLSKLANNIMDLSKAQSKTIVPHPVPFDINEMLRGSLLAMTSRFQQKNITPSAEFESPNLLVMADEEMIGRVIQNLMDNALKFTEEGGKIQVETCVLAGKASITIRDSGEGMTEEEMKHVFDRFYKADTSRGEDTSGSGLGLAIVKEFILLHGSPPTVSSKEGEGSAFSFVLPLAEAKKGQKVPEC